MIPTTKQLPIADLREHTSGIMNLDHDTRRKDEDSFRMLLSFAWGLLLGVTTMTGLLLLLPR